MCLQDFDIYRAMTVEFIVADSGNPRIIEKDLTIFSITMLGGSSANGTVDVDVNGTWVSIGLLSTNVSVNTISQPNHGRLPNERLRLNPGIGSVTYMITRFPYKSQQQDACEFNKE